MPVRTDRCPHCLAALSSEVGLACPHCRRSLVPEGRKARRAFEQERLARAKRAENVAPQSAHPHQPHPPAFVTDLPPAPVASSPPADPPPGVIPPPPGSPAWGAATIPPPPSQRGLRLRTVVRTLFAVVGFLVGAAVAGNFLGIIGTEPVATVESAAYDGPTFSVRLPAPVNVQTFEEEVASHPWCK